MGGLIPRMRPHGDRSSEISHPTSAYSSSWWMRFGLGCTTILRTPPRRSSSSRAQWEGHSGALLSHMLHVSARIPTTPFPVIRFSFTSSVCLHSLAFVAMSRARKERGDGTERRTGIARESDRERERKGGGRERERVLDQRRREGDTRRGGRETQRQRER